MEFLQYLKGQQLAWEGRANDLLDGQALDATHIHRIRHRGRGGGLSLVGLDDVGYEGGEDVRGTKEVSSCSVEEGQRQGPVRVD